MSGTLLKLRFPGSKVNPVFFPPSKADFPGSTVRPLRHPQPRCVLAFSFPTYVVVLKNTDIQMDMTILLSPVVGTAYNFVKSTRVVLSYNFLPRAGLSAYSQVSAFAAFPVLVERLMELFEFGPTSP